MPAMIAINRGRCMNQGQPTMPNIIDRKGCLRLDEGQLAMLHVLRNGNFDEKKCQALMATCTSGNGAIQESHAMPAGGSTGTFPAT